MRLEISSKHKSALTEFLRRLKEEIHDSEAYLFGSLARGDWLVDSDIDVIVVTDKLRHLKPWERSAKLRMLAPPHTGFDIIVYSREEFRAVKDYYDKLVKVL